MTSRQLIHRTGDRRELGYQGDGHFRRQIEYGLSGQAQGSEKEKDPATIHDGRRRSNL
jgi:hypothetical protein